ncbi:TonB-dependent receptor [Wenyingzhuangia aestuarii]|uniref:TonB-dependent receptor n=1 Tax=Wenyingzhuangia aestuarii TaxID=1647582 RepID=UPI001FD86941|nr:TonB-dependent receptor [Wenyingzhuangia aestuarii]NJB82153.1 TonB-linked SusC/RagA family outer membrane protein [Wenyingzhuangia aestuarii]
MKLTIYLFLFSLFNIHANTYSQKAKVTLDLKNVSVEKVFREIEAQTEFKVLYNNNEFNDKEIVSVNVRNVLVTSVLNNLFSNTDINYKTVGKQIVLVKGKTVLNTQNLITQQQFVVKGMVSDEFGMPIPGANVVVKGTTKGTITDFDGNYTLSVTNKTATLVFSYVGYKEKELPLNGKTTANVVLEQDVSELDAVVMVGYGTVKKSDVTGALSSIDTEQISKTQTTSIAQAIQGRAAGVTVSKSTGSPGATPTVRIRGTGTINNSDPLYVVDGVPINDISSINMEDAQSIEVLKDASATAIYGSRGANGVILITTKSGKKGTPTISYRMYAGVENKINNVDVLNAEQWATLYNEAKVNDGQPIDASLANPSSLTSYNWKDAVYRSGFMQNHQLSVSGGSDKSTYYISFGYINQNGIVKNSDYKRTNFRVNNTYQIKPKIKIGHNLQYANAEKTTVPEYSGNAWPRAAFAGYVVDPVTPIYNTDGTFGVTSYSSAINPLGLVQYGQSPQIRESFFGNVFLEATIIKGLTFKSNYGLQINNTMVDNFQPSYFVSPTYLSNVSTYRLNRSENRVMILSNTLNYNTTFNKKHTINALLGQEIQELNSNNVNTQRNGIPESVANPTLGSGDVSTASADGTISKSKLLSFFGRLNYNYDDRYLVTGTYRFDGSSRFGSNNKWAQFPSLALAWNIHKENFYDVDVINQLKFRAGWGETGNQNIPNTATYNTLNIGTNYLYGSDQGTALGVAPLQPGNPNLKWETTKTTNIGVDMALLNNAITFTAEYFVKNTSNMLMATPILTNAGYAQSPYTNAGDIENKGFEFSANYKKIINDFSFNIGGNISFIKNKVIKLADEGSIIQTGDGSGFKNIARTEAGQPLASFYGYVMDGIYQNQDEVDNGPTFLNSQPGDVRYKDLNDDGIIDDKDKTNIGSPFPEFTYGINIDMNYKQFDFTAFFQGSQGNKIFNASAYYLEGDLGTNLRTSMLDRWTGEETSNSVPRVTFANNGVNTALSSRFVRDGSYVRLKNVQLGYTVPNNVLNKVFINKLRVYVAGQNLVTFTKYDGLDPEVGIDSSQNNPLDIGIDRGRYPSVRTVSLGLDINF